jgi:hypothetical protein
MLAGWQAAGLMLSGTFHLIRSASFMSTRSIRQLRQLRFLLSAACLAHALFAFSPAALARPLAVLNFELVDATQEANDPLQIERTQRLGPLLREALAARGVELVDVPGVTAVRASPGGSYLFDRPQIAAAMGRSRGAEAVAVCRYDRSTATSSALRVRLVDAERSQVMRDFVVEIKDQFDSAAPRGTARLADDIADALDGK